MPAQKTFAFQLEHPYGGRLPGYSLGEAVVVHATTVPELMDKLSSLFMVSYQEVSTRRRETL
jgi:hypothetical protein